jgi:hypothetical protein
VTLELVTPNGIELRRRTPSSPTFDPSIPDVTIEVTRWSTAQDNDELVTALRRAGTKGFSDSLSQRPEAYGTIRAGGMFYSQGLRFAYQISSPGGRRLLVATLGDLHRNLTLQSAIAPSSNDAPFTVLEIRWDKDGRAQGKAAYGQGLVVGDRNTIEIGAFEQQPVVLAEILER